jgi:competence protein ComEA
MRDPLIEYLTFSKKERLGIFILLIVIAGIGVVPAFIPAQPLTADTVALRMFTDQLAVLDDGKSDSLPSASNTNEEPGDHDGMKRFSTTGNNRRKPESFIFDPNTISTADWVRLGVSEKTAITIGRYKAKGGKFRQPADILRIFGLAEADKQRLLPLVHISAAGLKNFPSFTPGRRDSLTRSAAPVGGSFFRRKTLKEIDINKADTATWSSLPGIGAVLSSRIVSYRERLGGFYDPSQVAEIYGLTDSVFQTLRPFLVCSRDVRKIDLNAVSPDMLQQHPYLKKRQALAIIDYRAQHGQFKDISEIKQVIAITEDTYRKMAPYLSL